MKSGTSFIRRFVPLAVAGILVVVLAACTGRGGGYLPPNEPPGFTGPASFGFTFSCEDKGGVNPPTGQLRIELAYTEHGTYPLVGSPFSIHGIVDSIAPIQESMFCIGDEPPPPSEEFGNQLIFLGRYRPMTSSPAGLQACPTRQTRTTPLCRFEVIVRDNDQDFAPSPGDYFSIKLSTITDPFVTIFPDGPPVVPYFRAGLLAGGNLTVR